MNKELLNIGQIFVKNTDIKRDRPEWFKKNLAPAGQTRLVSQTVHHQVLNTVCQSAQCPNKQECWAKNTATFMILGNTCSRFCRFCAVSHGEPSALDCAEPERVADAIQKLNISHAVVTSVTRDDLLDEGAHHFNKVISEIKKTTPSITIEVLTPDFHGRKELIKIVLESSPDVYGHNLETVERLTSHIRHRASYSCSLSVIQSVKELKPDIVTKSGIMVGLGETEDDIIKTMDDLLNVGCDILTLGHYLRPTREQLPVVKYYSLEDFIRWQEIAISKGFKYVVSHPMARSSYHAEEAYRQVKKTK